MIVTTPALVSQLELEFTRVAPGLVVTCFDTTPRSNVVLTSYDLLDHFQSTEWHRVVFDGGCRTRAELCAEGRFRKQGECPHGVCHPCLVLLSPESHVINRKAISKTAFSVLAERRWCISGLWLSVPYFDERCSLCCCCCCSCYWLTDVLIVLQGHVSRRLIRRCSGTSFVRCASPVCSRYIASVLWGPLFSSLWYEIARIRCIVALVLLPFGEVRASSLGCSLLLLGRCAEEHLDAQQVPRGGHVTSQCSSSTSELQTVHVGTRQVHPGRCRRHGVVHSTRESP